MSKYKKMKIYYTVCQTHSQTGVKKNDFQKVD